MLGKHKFEIKKKYIMRKGHNHENKNVKMRLKRSKLWYVTLKLRTKMSLLSH